jgi:hypothetical protein
MIKKTFRDKFWWVRKIIGPLFLLVCAFIPDLGPGGLVPVVLLIVFITSALSAVRTIKPYRRIAMNLWTRDLLRPGFAIIIVILDVALLYVSSSMATQFAIETARTAQKICQEKKECPSWLVCALQGASG